MPLARKAAPELPFGRHSPCRRRPVWRDVNDPFSRTAPLLSVGVVLGKHASAVTHVSIRDASCGEDSAWTQVLLTGNAVSNGRCDFGISSGNGNADDFALIKK